MSYLLLVLYILECCFLLIWGLKHPHRVYEFPFLAAAVFSGWVLPQLIGLTGDPFLPEGALEKTILMSGICLGMCYLGYVWNRKPMEIFNWSFSNNRLLVSSAVLILFGAYFFFIISRLPEELTSESQWEGLPVLYLYFANSVTYGFAIALLLIAHRNSKLALGFAFFATLFFIDRIFIGGRRGVALEFGLMILLAFWFGKRVIIPRPVMIAGICFGALIFFSIGEYRSITRGAEGFEIERITEIDFFENFKKIAEEKGGPEMRNALYNIQAVDETKNFDYGLFHWNKLIFNFVPGQLIGDDFKQSLLIPRGEPAYRVYGHIPKPGSTYTGMTDTFQSFWYFGAFKFFVIGFILSRVYKAAIMGSISAQLFYMVIIASSLQTITHHTQWFFSGWINLSFFLVPALLISRRYRLKFLDYSTSST